VEAGNDITEFKKMLLLMRYELLCLFAATSHAARNIGMRMRTQADN